VSVSTLWVVSAIDDRAQREWGPVWTQLFDGYASQADLHDKWRSWLEDSRSDRAFVELFTTVADGGWQQLSQFLAECASEARTDAHVARGLPAVAALFDAIGPVRARLLPGFLGNFMLTSSQLAAALPDIEAAFTFAPEQRRLAHERMDQALVDSPILNSDEVLDTLPRRGRWAADRGLGLASISQAIA
jgi:hypothetical protein